MTEQSVDYSALNLEVKEIWNKNAEFWDDRMGEGNRYHNELIAPAQERLLALGQGGGVVLDVACGNGQFARRMAHLGARVVAFDLSERLIERARARTTEDVDRIEYHVIDGTNVDAVMALGSRRFDAAVCTMALMDISTIDPLISSLSQLLRVGGRFVFSVTHPCFNSVRIKMVLEEEDRDGQWAMEYSVMLSEYIVPSPRKGIAMLGQPVAQYYFERPISMLLNTCFDAGFVMDGMEEPVFDRSVYAERTDDGASPGAWWNQDKLPPVLVARMRLSPPQ